MNTTPVLCCLAGAPRAPDRLRQRHSSAGLDLPMRWICSTGTRRAYRNGVGGGGCTPLSRPPRTAHHLYAHGGACAWAGRVGRQGCPPAPQRLGSEWERGRPCPAPSAGPDQLPRPPAAACSAQAGWQLAGQPAAPAAATEVAGTGWWRAAHAALRAAQDVVAAGPHLRLEQRQTAHLQAACHI